jgi:phage host-nuclease inhibitor protein Gam
MPATLNNINNNTTTAAQRKNAKRREKKRLEQLQVEEQKQEKTIPTKKEEEEGANAEQEEYLTTEIKQLRKQLQQCERIERKRIEDESKVRPSEWVKLGEYDETVDALEKLQRDLANMQFPASEEKKEKKERKE